MRTQTAPSGIMSHPALCRSCVCAHPRHSRSCPSAQHCLIHLRCARSVPKLGTGELEIKKFRRELNACGYDLVRVRSPCSGQGSSSMPRRTWGSGMCCFCVGSARRGVGVCGRIGGSARD